MRTKFSGILTLLLAFMVQFTFAQQKTITGTVSDETGPLPGVSVIIKGTNNGTETDFDGKYSISANVGDVLVYSFVGMSKQEKTVGTADVINVVLVADNVLEEVVVIGYGNTTKEKSSIASTTITAEAIENRPNASVVQTLTGQIAGLDIATNSGQPGANSVVNIRGISSINGDTEPLFIIDGAPVDQDNFRSLNPNEIASISVLKDAGATAIYGNRGANGVIIIKTRSGSFNSGLQINYSGLLSYSSIQDNDYNLMNSQEQLQLERQQGLGLGGTAYESPSRPLTDAEIAAFPTTDWTDVFFRTALTQAHTLSLSSGSENFRSYVALGFQDQEGILVQSGLKRFNFRSNVGGKSKDDKFDYSLNLSVNYSESDEPNFLGSGAINRNFVLAAYQSVPYLTPDDYTTGAALLSPLRFANTPLFMLDRLATFTRSDDEVRMIGSLNANYKIIDGLTAGVTISSDFADEVNLRAEGPTSFNALLFAPGGAANTTPGTQDQQNNKTFTYNQVTSLRYNKEFGKHTLDVGLFTEYFKAHFKTFGFRQRGLNPSTFAPGDGSAFIADVADNDFFNDTPNANIIEAGLFSYFGQADYDYDTKYGLTATLRRDASFRFAESNRWATFYSVAGRWNLHNEEFMQGSVFNALKLRASYGTAGNQNIVGSLFGGPDLTRDLYTTGTGYLGANSISLGTFTGLGGRGQIGNSTLEWETVTSVNVGVDFEVFDRRFRGNIDWYKRNTTNLFQQTPVSSINAVTQLDANIGELQNSGFDITLHYDLVKQGFDGLNIGLDVVGNYNKTEIIDLPGDETELIGTGRVGGKLFEYFVYRYAGVNPANGNLLFLTADGNVTENPNVDTDRVWLDKNVFPDFQGSFGFTVDYKGFFMTTQWQYQFGVDRFDNDLNGFVNADNIGQFRSSRDLLRAWTPTNQVTDIPRLDAANRALGGGSTRFLRNSDLVRLRFAQVGYTFPSKFLDGTGIANAKLFVNGENLLNFTEWRGYDSGLRSNTSRLFPTPRTISFGLEVGF